MDFGRREIVTGLMAIWCSAGWAAPKEDCAVAGRGKSNAWIGYVIAEDPADPNAIWITEVWDSKENHDASLSLPEVKKAITAARPMITGFTNQVTTTPIGGFGLTVRAPR